MLPALTESTYLTQFGDFDVELSLTSTRDELRVNDDGIADPLILDDLYLQDPPGVDLSVYDVSGRLEAQTSQILLVP